eukprot:8253711-Pyramimonas_sp.AAC.1
MLWGWVLAHGALPSQRSLVLVPSFPKAEWRHAGHRAAKYGGSSVGPLLWGGRPPVGSPPTLSA